MKLTQWTDYSLRVLMYCAARAAQNAAAPATIAEIASAHGISRSHLTKIVMTLAGLGWLETTRGRGGGIRLLVPAEALSVGAVVRRTEGELTLVECFDPALNTCRLDGRCRLKGALEQALSRYLEVLDGVTIADLVAPVAVARGGGDPARLRHVPGLPPAAARR